MSAAITVVICTYNRLACLRIAIDSVIPQLEEISEAELIVVDDGSTDGTSDWLKSESERWPKTVHFYAQANQGLSAARNFGWTQANSAWVAYLDDDAIAPPGWLASLSLTCQHVPADVAVIGGPIRLKWEQPRPNWLPDSLEKWLTCFDAGSEPKTSANVPLFAGANMTCRVEGLKRVGGFSPHLGRQGGSLLSREECELAEKLAQSGYVSRYEPAPWVWHCAHADRLRRSWFMRRLYWEGRSLTVSDKSLRTLSTARRKARATLYACKTLLAPSPLLHALRFDRPQTQMEALGRFAFHYGFAGGIWRTPFSTN